MCRGTTPKKAKGEQYDVVYPYPVPPCYFKKAATSVAWTNSQDDDTEGCRNIPKQECSACFAQCCYNHSRACLRCTLIVCLECRDIHRQVCGGTMVMYNTASDE